MRTQRVLKVTKSRSMVNIKQYVYSQYRHTLTKIDARASKNLPPPQLSHSLWHVLRSRLALWHIIGTLLLWRIRILPLGPMGLMYIGTHVHWHHLPCLHLTQKPRGQYLTKEDIFAFHVAVFIVCILYHIVHLY